MSRRLFTTSFEYHVDNKSFANATGSRSAGRGSERRINSELTTKLRMG
jgi:hypothetical protein